MNKEKLKELLNNPELENFLSEHFRITVVDFNQFIEQKRKELSEPVYKTEDGYEAEKMDGVYIIGEKTISPAPFVINAPYKQFKLKENAENYLIENAEVLSLNEHVQIVEEMNQQNRIDWKEFFKQKIRQKLGL